MHFNDGLICISMNLPKRLELSLRMVLALPNASNSGLQARIYIHDGSPYPLLNAVAHHTVVFGDQFKHFFVRFSLTSAGLAAD
jgi:hypothetical protein